MSTSAAPLDRTNAELGRLFASAPAGRIPSGRSYGTGIVIPGTKAASVIAETVRVLLWQGKVFDDDRHDLFNLLSPFAIKAIRADVYEGASLFDEKPCIVLDYSKSSFVAASIRDEMREIEPGRYLGLVYVAGRRMPVWFFLEFDAAAAA